MDVKERETEKVIDLGERSGPTEILTFRLPLELANALHRAAHCDGAMIMVTRRESPDGQPPTDGKGRAPVLKHREWHRGLSDEEAIGALEHHAAHMRSKRPVATAEGEALPPEYANPGEWT